MSLIAFFDANEYGGTIYIDPSEVVCTEEVIARDSGDEPIDATIVTLRCGHRVTVFGGGIGRRIDIARGGS